MIGVLTKQPLVARADIGIRPRFIAEVLAAEKAAIALVVNCALDGNMRHHACRFAVSDLLSIGVTGVSTIWKLSTSGALFAASTLV